MASGRAGNIGYSLMETAHQFLLGHLTCSKFFKQFFEDVLIVWQFADASALTVYAPTDRLRVRVHAYPTLERCCISIFVTVAAQILLQLLPFFGFMFRRKQNSIRQLHTWLGTLRNKGELLSWGRK